MLMKSLLSLDQRAINKRRRNVYVLKRMRERHHGGELCRVGDSTNRISCEGIRRGRGRRRAPAFLHLLGGEHTFSIDRFFFSSPPETVPPDETSLISLRVFFSSLLARPPQYLIWRALILVLNSHLYYLPAVFIPSQFLLEIFFRARVYLQQSSPEKKRERERSLLILFLNRRL